MLMVYLEAREKNGKTYFYAKESYRDKGTVKTRTISYLGTKKKAAEKQLKAMNDPPLLNKDEQQQVKGITLSYAKFLRSLDPLTKEEVQKDFMLLFVHETNSLEGSSFTVKETKMLLEDNITPDGKELREVYEQVNTKKLFDAHDKKPFKITVKDIVHMHEIFMQNIDPRTGFRTRRVRILGSTTKTSAPEYVKTDMKLLIKWFEKHEHVLHPLTLAALFHAKFEQIHPFADGNGRIGRFLAHVILHKTMPILFPGRKKYLDSLEASQNKSLDSTVRKDFDEIIKYFIFAYEDTWKNFFSER